MRTMRVRIAWPPPLGHAWTEQAVAGLVGQRPRIREAPEQYAQVIAARLLPNGHAELTLEVPEHFIPPTPGEYSIDVDPIPGWTP